MQLNFDHSTDVKSRMKQTILILLLLLAVPLAAQEQDSEAPQEGQASQEQTSQEQTSEEQAEQEWTPKTPSELAAESDYVVLAQLDIYKYQKRRDIPVSGDSWFDVLVPYKVPRPVERFKVVEEGYGERKCYFEADLWNEMPRYLLFLVDYPDGDAGEVRGHPDGCALSVLTTTDNKYVVRWPIENMRFETDIESLVEEFEFQGPGATVDLSDRIGFRREEEVERLFLEPVETDDRGRDFIYRYTRGIPLGVFREQVLGTEHLTRDRVQRGG